MTYFKPHNPNFLELIKEKMKDNSFMHYVGFEPTNIEAGCVEGRIELKPHHRQQSGFVHGGVTTTIADLVSGWAAFTLAEKGKTVVTAELKTNFLNPGTGNLLVAKGVVIKTGSMLTFTECEIFCNNNNNHTLIAKSYGIFASINLP